MAGPQRRTASSVGFLKAHQARCRTGDCDALPGPAHTNPGCQRTPCRVEPSTRNSVGPVTFDKIQSWTGSPLT